MKLSIISFTENGISLSNKVAGQLADTQWEVSLFSKCSHGSVPSVTESLADWTGMQMKERNALLFIGACGIAVRAIAPHLVSKLEDSPVLVMDEKGEYVIPLLSGHVGGANELAKLIAGKTGAFPVITTATDLNHRFAVDVFAKRNHLYIENKAGIAKVSSKILAGEEISISIEEGHLDKMQKLPEGLNLVTYPPCEKVDVLIREEKKREDGLATDVDDEVASILLRPKEYVIGMGCRRGKEEEKIEKLIADTLETLGINRSQIYALATVEQKKDEEGLLAWSRKNRIPFLTYEAGRLQEISGNFSGSDFVRETIGVDNVCERAALAACGEGGILIANKKAIDGMTIAVAKREWRVSFYEE